MMENIQDKWNILVDEKLNYQTDREGIQLKTMKFEFQPNVYVFNYETKSSFHKFT